jgi:chromosome segregation ATPase
LELVAFPSTPVLQNDGLPYWIFWFMLFIILLLGLFIFLRNKGLRTKISSFLAGARRRSILIRLRFQLKKEQQKKAGLLKRLGEKAWGEDIRVQDDNSIRARLKELFEKKNASQLEWDKAFAEIEKFHKQLEDTISLHNARIQELKNKKSPYEDLLKRRKQEEKALKKVPHKDREIERQIDEVKDEELETRDRLDELEADIKAVETEAKDRRQGVEKDIHHWTRKKEKIQHRIKDIEEDQEAMYLSLGRLIEEKKVQHQALDDSYTQLKGANLRIETLKHRIDTMSGG